MHIHKYKGSVWDWNYYAMKQLPIILMIMTIFAGIVLAISPVLMNYMFPEINSNGRYANPERATEKLRQWFSSPEADFSEVKSIQQSIGKGIISRFSFSVERQPVQRFIKSSSLKQTPLTPDIMSSEFTDDTLKWWQPEGLTRETYFTGSHQGRRVSLIYNAEQQRGVLQVSNF